MLLFSREVAPDLRFAAWKVEESPDFFRDQLPLTPEEQLELSQRQHPLRQSEWLASRWLLHLLTGAGDRMPLRKTATSKPFFLNAPQLHCSLSHSHGTVAALLSSTICGCDIQAIVPKMPRIAPKFMREDELEWAESRQDADYRLDMMHLIWTAKEAMYKAYGLKAVDFKAHLYITPFDWERTAIHTSAGRLIQPGFQQNFELFSGFFDDEQTAFVWTVAKYLTENQG